MDFIISLSPHITSTFKFLHYDNKPVNVLLAEHPQAKSNLLIVILPLIVWVKISIQESSLYFFFCLYLIFPRI